jgi:glucose-1-phosphate cytidylyltransferase
MLRRLFEWAALGPLNSRRLRTITSRVYQNVYAEEGSCEPMKVVLFAGGFGVRMGEQTQRIPKAMIHVGTQPILVHIMKYYAACGHTEFVVCLGYRAESIKEYFLKYNEALANDFVLSNGGREVRLLASDISDWRITFVDTGARSTIGDRLRLVAKYLGDETYFLATYGDGLTDAPLPDTIRRLQDSGKSALFLLTRPKFSAHVVSANGDGIVTVIEDMQQADVWINAGFFVLRRDVIDLLEPGDELVEEGFARLMERQELLAYRYEGFWGPMDTIRDKQQLDALIDSGHAPWRHVGMNNLTPVR